MTKEYGCRASLKANHYTGLEIKTKMRKKTVSASTNAVKFIVEKKLLGTKFTLNGWWKFFLSSLIKYLLLSCSFRCREQRSFSKWSLTHRVFKARPPLPDVPYEHSERWSQCDDVMGFIFIELQHEDTSPVLPWIIQPPSALLDNAWLFVVLFFFF